MSHVEACKTLIASVLSDEYSTAGDYYTLVEEAAGKILEDSSVALWAQSTSGEKMVNMMMPSIRRALQRLVLAGKVRRVVTATAWIKTVNSLNC